MQNRCRLPVRTVIGNSGNSVAPNMHINFIASNNKSIDNNCETHLIVVLKGGNNASDSRRKLQCAASENSRLDYALQWQMMNTCIV